MKNKYVGKKREISHYCSCSLVTNLTERSIPMKIQLNHKTLLAKGEKEKSGLYTRDSCTWSGNLTLEGTL